MDPIFRVVSPPKKPSCAHPAHACFIMLWMPMSETFVMKHMCLSVDQEVSLEVAQGSKIWICRTIFRCTVRTHVVRGDCFPLNLHGGGDNYIHITNIDYNT